MTADQPGLDDLRRPSGLLTAIAALHLLIALVLLATIATLPVLFQPTIDGQIATDPTGDAGDPDGRASTTIRVLFYFTVFAALVAVAAVRSTVIAAQIRKEHPSARTRSRRWAGLVALFLGLPGAIDSRASTFLFTIDSGDNEFTAMGRYVIDQHTPAWLHSFDVLSTTVFLAAPAAILLLLALSNRRPQAAPAA